MRFALERVAMVFARDIISLHIWSFSLIRFIYSHFLVIFSLFLYLLVLYFVRSFNESEVLRAFDAGSCCYGLFSMFLSFAFVIFTKSRFYVKISLWNVCLCIHSDDLIVENVCHCCCCWLLLMFLLLLLWLLVIVVAKMAFTFSLSLKLIRPTVCVCVCILVGQKSETTMDGVVLEKIKMQKWMYVWKWYFSIYIYVNLCKHWQA